MEVTTLGAVVALPLWLLLFLVMVAVLGVVSIIEHIVLCCLWTSHKARSTLRMIAEIDQRRRRGEFKDRIKTDPDD